MFDRTIKITAINPTHKIKLGKQNSLLPNKNVYVSEYKKENQQKTNIYFIEPNNKNDLDNVQHILSSNGINASYINSDNYHLGYNLFFQTNIIFVIVLSLITVFATLMHYISRTKEISILKINGKSAFSISFALYKKRAYSYIQRTIDNNSSILLLYSFKRCITTFLLFRISFYYFFSNIIYIFNYGFTWFDIYKFT